MHPISMSHTRSQIHSKIETVNCEHKLRNQNRKLRLFGHKTDPIAAIAKRSRRLLHVGGLFLCDAMEESVEGGVMSFENDEPGSKVDPEPTGNDGKDKDKDEKAMSVTCCYCSKALSQSDVLACKRDHLRLMCEEARPWRWNVC